MRVGFFSPMPPARTGVADYSAALLNELRKHGDVRLNDGQADVALYHVGNNQLHREIYARAIERPGIVVLHDAVLQHFFLGSMSEGAYVDEFVYNYGEWMRDMARDLWRNRARSAVDPKYFAYPMLKRIAGGARAVIVHNPAAAAAVRRHAAEARLIEIPHLFTRPARVPDEVERLRFREGLGIGPRTLLVGAFGHMRESKRLMAMVRAMKIAWAAGADARLLVAGEFASSDLKRAWTGMDDRRILRTGFLSDYDFWRYAAATDVCVNLRFPRAAETSGIAVRLMGIGRAVVFTEGEEIARIPENACLRVDANEAEEEMLAAMVEWMGRDREVAREIGKRAARHVEEWHESGRVGRRYWEAMGKAVNEREST